VYISGEGIAVNGTVQVRFSGGTRWALADGSTDGQLIKPAYGALRALAREHRVGEPGALPATLELRADPRAPSDIVRDLLYTAGQAGWRSFAIGAANDLSEQLQPVWLPSLGSATTTHSVLQAAAAARPTGLVILGSVDPAQLNKALRQPPAGMTRCWERAVRQDPNQGGRLELRIVIGSDGGVNDAAIAMSELDNPSLEACILEAFEDADFPRPSGHGIAIIEYPMVLEPVWAEEN
jgi:hypothetical protein